MGRRGHRQLGQLQGEDAVVEAGDNLIRRHLHRQLDGARHAAIIALAAQGPFILVLAVKLADLRLQGHQLAVHVHVDVLLRHPGQFRLQQVVIPALPQIQLDLAGQRVPVQGADVEAGGHVVEQVIKQAGATR